MKPILCKTCLGGYFSLEKLCVEFSFRNEIEFISKGHLTKFESDKHFIINSFI